MHYTLSGRVLSAVVSAAFLAGCSSSMKTTPAASLGGSLTSQTSAVGTLSDAAKTNGGAVSNTFDSFTPGPIVPQHGWLGSGCGYSASHIDSASTYPSANFSGTNAPSKVLVVFNASDDGCYNGLGSPPLANPAGNEDSYTIPDPSWTVCGEACLNHFSAQWTVTSSTGDYQTGCFAFGQPTSCGMSLSPVYNNDGARMAYVGMEWVLDKHGKKSLHIFAYDVDGVCKRNTTNTCGNAGPAPCFQCANFVFHDVAFVDPKVEHTIGMTVDFGQSKKARDKVSISVDGKNMWTGGSWQDYYTMDTESDNTGVSIGGNPGGMCDSPGNPTPGFPSCSSIAQHPGSRAVNDLLLHGNGSAGSGFLYRNVTVSTY